MELTLAVGPSLDHGTLPFILIVIFSRDFLYCLKQRLPQNQPFPLNLSKCHQQAGVLHFSKLSSSFKHLECNLHVGSIWALIRKKDVNFCDGGESKNDYPHFK